jgi:hypothetical protein
VLHSLNFAPMAILLAGNALSLRRTHLKQLELQVRKTLQVGPGALQAAKLWGPSSGADCNLTVISIHAGSLPCQVYPSRLRCNLPLFLFYIVPHFQGVHRAGTSGGAYRGASLLCL